MILYVIYRQEHIIADTEIDTLQRINVKMASTFASQEANEKVEINQNIVFLDQTIDTRANDSSDESTCAKRNH